MWEKFKLKKVKIVLSFIATLGILALGSMSVKAENEAGIDSRASVMIEAKTGKILHENNADEKLAIASVSKIVTMYMVLDKIHSGKGKWDEVVHIDDYLLDMSKDSVLGGTYLYGDKKYTVEDLFKAMVIESSNSSTMALGNWVSGNQTQYIKDANKWLSESVGLKDYSYVSASGLENSDLGGYMVEGTNSSDYNKFSAKDVSIIAMHLIDEYPEVLKTANTMSTKMSTGQSLSGHTTVFKGGAEYDEDLNIDGLKTGFTNVAGNTFVGTAEKNGMRLITVTLNTDNYGRDTKKMLKYGFGNYKVLELNNKEVLKGSKIKVLNGNKKLANIELESEKTQMIALKEVKSSDISAKLTNVEIEAPKEKGDIVSKIEYLNKKDSLGYVNPDGNKVGIKITESVKKK